MRDKKVIDEMVSLAERFGQKIEFDEFDGRGGWCRVKGTDRVIINERLTPREQIRIMAQVLAGYPIEEQAMPPKIRQIIEDARSEQAPEPEPGPLPEQVSEPPQPEEPAQIEEPDGTPVAPEQIADPQPTMMQGTGQQPQADQPAAPEPESRGHGSESAPG